MSNNRLSSVVTIAFDVYGTLVEPLAMHTRVRPLVGDAAERLAALWREKQLEYAFRRGLMGHYESFDICTRHALQYALAALGLSLNQSGQEQLLEQYEYVPPFPDALVGLAALREQGHTLVAFSNGVAATVRRLLTHAGLIEFLTDVVSVDEVRTFKPNPAVYHHLVRRTGRSPAATWLVSANGWDVLGAKAAGLRGVWLQRRPEAILDPWGITPDVTIRSLVELAEVQLVAR